MIDRKFAISFFCYYPDSDQPCKKVQVLKLADIPKWIDAYKFTHPACQAITVKVWCNEKEA